MIDPCRECGTDFIFTQADLDEFMEEVNVIHRKHKTVDFVTGILEGLFIGICTGWWIWG